jgi:hypothetical protein
MTQASPPHRLPSAPAPRRGTVASLRDAVLNSAIVAMPWPADDGGALFAPRPERSGA